MRLKNGFSLSNGSLESICSCFRDFGLESFNNNMNKFIHFKKIFLFPQLFLNKINGYYKCLNHFKRLLNMVVLSNLIITISYKASNF